MTKQIEDVLNLPRLTDVLKESEAKETENVNESSLDKFKELQMALEGMSSESILSSEHHIDEIKKEALRSYKDMLDAGFACDSKHASNFLEPAVQALNIALDSEKTRTNRKVDYMRIKLQQEKNDLLRRKLELEEKKFGQNTEITDEKTVYMDRNEMLKILLSDKDSIIDATENKSE